MRLYSFAIVLAATLITPIAQAVDDPLSWPHFRGNREHNGRSLGTGAIVKPAIQTSLKLGGSTTPTKMRFDDFVYGPTPELLIVESGRLYLKTTSNKIIWHTDALGIADLIGVYDLDKDGTEEAIATIPGPDAQIAIFAIETGELLWLVDQFGIGSSIVRAEDPVVTDLNGDGFLDLLCSAVINDEINHAFSFAHGYQATAANNILWEAPQKTYGQTIPYLVGDLDGDQLNEVVYLEYKDLNILAGGSGTEQLRQTGVFMNYSFGPTALTNIDTDPELEIVAIGTEWYNLALTTFDASAGAEGIIWQYQWYPTSGKRLVGSGRSVVDVDNDGELEIVVGIYNNGADEITTSGSTPGEYDGIDEPKRWVTAIYNARDGVLEHYLANRQFLGIAPVITGEPPFILTRETTAGEINPSNYGTVITYKFASDTYTPTSSILRARPLTQTAPKSATATSSTVLLTEDLNDDDRQEIFVAIDGDMNGDADTIEALDIAGSSVIRRSWIALDDWHAYTPITTWHPVNENTRLIWKLNNGELHQLNEKLVVVKRTELDEYEPMTISADLNTTNGNEILTTHSTGRFVAYDWQPKRLESEWELQTNRQGPMIAFDRNGDGTNELALTEYIDRESPKLTVLESSGQILWQKTFNGYGSPVVLLSAGDFDGDATVDLVVSISDTRLDISKDLRVVALSGNNGAQLWNVPAQYNRYIAGTLHIADLSGDGIDDVTIVDTSTILTFDGVDGSILSLVPYSAWSYTHFGADIDGDDVNELVLMNFFADPGTELFEFGQTNNTWNIPHNYDFELNFSWASVYTATPGLGLIRATPAGSISAFDSEGQPVWGPFWVRDGRLIASDPGGANDIRYLSVADIDNDGIEDAIFGTEDGHLLAIATTDGSLTWSLPLYSPAGEAILSDVDGDSQLEIVVSGQDGYIHVVDEQTLGKPKNVQDLSPSTLSTTSRSTTSSGVPEDVDTTLVRTALGAGWDPVKDADGYLLSAIDAAGVLLQPWIDVGNVTSATIQTAPLPLNATYHMVVKAYTLDGEQSADSTSDGVLIRDDTAPFATLNVDPPIFNPQKTDTVVSFDIGDSTWLREYVLAIKAPSEGAVTEIEAGLYGTESSETVTWPWRYIDGSLLLDGSYTVELSATDDANNTSTFQTAVIIDTVAPTPPTLNVQLDSENRPKFLGASEPDSLVAVTIDGFAICSTTADLNGHWRCYGQPLPLGQFTALAVADDLALNRSAPGAPVVFQVVTEPDHPAHEVHSEAKVPGVPYDCSCRAAGTLTLTQPPSLFAPLMALWL